MVRTSMSNRTYRQFFKPRVWPRNIANGERKSFVNKESKAEFEELIADLRVSLRPANQLEELREALLPEKLPEIDGIKIGVAYKTCSVVGGDYYDFMLLKSDSLLPVVADVEGKGVASALMMANL